MINESDIVRLYKDGQSTYEIAKQYETNPNAIRRKLIKNGIKLRTKGEAQKIALESGRVQHPTKGKERTDEEKLAISSSAVKYWEEMGDEEREKRRKQSESSWNNMTPSQIEEMRKKGGEQIRKAAKEGSKLEKKVQGFLAFAGYVFEAHKKNLIPTENLEIDIYVPELRTIIEVDGISHFEPIWSEEALEGQISADNKKDGILLSRGFQIVRIENRTSSMAIAKLTRLQKELASVLLEIKQGTIDTKFKVIKYD
jgi:very-short-patch-repair endonuclease/DNA-binding CsgD family transcriptional regulator